MHTDYDVIDIGENILNNRFLCEVFEVIAIKIIPAFDS